MWAYIKDNKIEQIYQRPKSLVLGEVRYPSNMFTKYTDAEKAAIGIYPVEDSGTKGMIDLKILHKLHILGVLLIKK